MPNAFYCLTLHRLTAMCNVIIIAQSHPLADPGLQKRGQIFYEIFQRPFLGISRKNFCIPQKIPHVSPKFSDDFFFNHRPFRVLLYGIFPWGGKSVADIATGGPKSLLFNKITILPLLFLSQRGGQTPFPISMGGHGRICPPWIRHC